MRDTCSENGDSHKFQMYGNTVHNMCEVRLEDSKYHFKDKYDNIKQTKEGIDSRVTAVIYVI